MTIKEYIFLHHKTRTPAMIIADLKVHPHSVYNAFILLRIKPLTKTEYKLMYLKEHSENKTLRQLAEELGMSYNGLANFCSKHNIRCKLEGKKIKC